MTSDIDAPRRSAVVPALAGHTGHLLRAAYMAALDHARAALPADHQPREFGLLSVLASGGPRSQQQLGQLLNVNRTIMVKVIDGLEVAGLVERRRNPADRRSYALELTPRGRAWLTQITPAIMEAEAAFSAPLSAAERERLNVRLRELLVGLGLGPAPDVLADRTGYLLAAAHHHMRDAFEAALRPAAIEPRQFAALATIAASGPCSQQLVADQLGVSGPVVVSLVDELEERGLVERRRNPADRRSYALEPTAQGRVVRRKAQAAVEELDALVTAAIGPERDEELRTLLRKMLGLY